MGLKKRSKVSAEFSMSSLTDIIFLLLIFFMLTSSLVAPNSLNLKLPGSGTPPKTASKDKIDDVRIDKKGRFYFNGKQYGFSKLEQTLARNAKRKKNYTITMSPESGTPTEFVAKLMDISLKYNINGILATELKK
ncbi:MAG: biopolymer transport protein ExbD [Paraglaciecola sp.]|jgi:biopolymer transport protein ExbD